MCPCKSNQHWVHLMLTYTKEIFTEKVVTGRKTVKVEVFLLMLVLLQVYINMWDVKWLFCDLGFFSCWEWTFVTNDHLHSWQESRAVSGDCEWVQGPVSTAGKNNAKRSPRSANTWHHYPYVHMEYWEENHWSFWRRKLSYRSSTTSQFPLWVHLSHL